MEQYGEYGNNKNGELGDGISASKNTLSKISGLDNIEKIACGENFGIAIDKVRKYL